MWGTSELWADETSLVAHVTDISATEFISALAEQILPVSNRSAVLLPRGTAKEFQPHIQHRSAKGHFITKITDRHGKIWAKPMLVQAEVRRRQDELRQQPQVPLPNGRRAGPPSCTTLCIKGAPKEIRKSDLDRVLQNLRDTVPVNHRGTPPELLSALPKIVPRDAFIMCPKGVKEGRIPQRIKWSGEVGIYSDHKEIHEAIYIALRFKSITITGVHCTVEINNNQGWIFRPADALPAPDSMLE